MMNNVSPNFTVYSNTCVYISIKLWIVIHVYINNELIIIDRCCKYGKLNLKIIKLCQAVVHQCVISDTDSWQWYVWAI